MKFAKQGKRYNELGHMELIHFDGKPGYVYKPGFGYSRPLAGDHVPVVFPGSSNIHHLHYADLATAVPEPEPEEEEEEYREMNLYVNPTTGAVYQNTGSHLVCINSAVPSMPATQKSRLKRLYREV